MKKKISLMYCSFLLSASTAFAQLKLDPSDKPEGLPQQTDFIKLVVDISNVVLSIVGVVAVLFIIIGGFQYITSAGNADQVEKAKKTLLYAIIGLVIVILSWAVVNFVLTSFGTKTK